MLLLLLPVTKLGLLLGLLNLLGLLLLPPAELSLLGLHLLSLLGIPHGPLTRLCASAPAGSLWLSRKARPDLVRAVIQRRPAESVLRAALGVDGAYTIARIAPAAGAELLGSGRLLLLLLGLGGDQHSILVELRSLGSRLKLRLLHDLLRLLSLLSQLPSCLRIIGSQISHLVIAVSGSGAAESVLRAALVVIGTDRVSHVPPAARSEDAGRRAARRGRRNVSAAEVFGRGGGGDRGVVAV